jgi:hypothetical protein
MSEVRAVEVSDVYLHDRRGTVVRHVQRSDEDKTLCGKPLDHFVQPQAINLLCLACYRAREDFLARQSDELRKLAEWNRMESGQDAPQPGVSSFPRFGSVGCVFGSVVEVPNDEG